MLNGVVHLIAGATDDTGRLTGPEASVSHLLHSAAPTVGFECR